MLRMTCDVGSNNLRLFHLLCGNSVLPDGGWLPVECVRTKNPYKKKKGDPPRYIYLWKKREYNTQRLDCYCD